MNFKLLVSLFIGATFILSSLAGDEGILELDDHTFPKLVGKDFNVFVEFVEYGWKTTTDYKDVADNYKTSDDILIAKVDISNVNDASLKLENPPVGRFYPKGSLSFSEFDGDLEDASAIIGFIDSNLNPLLKKLNELVKSFSANIGAGKTAEAEKAQKDAEATIEELGEEFKESTGKIFSVIFKRIKDKGATFAQSEFDRVSNIVKGGSLSEKKAKQMKQRLNILRTFGASDAEAASKKEEL